MNIIRIENRNNELSYPKEFEVTAKILNLTGKEAVDRLILQNAIDKKIIQDKILYDGNTVYGKNEILKEFRKLFRQGSLTPMSNIAYEFLTNCCGSIAHYDKNGWIATYNNSIYSLRNFFKKNEYGENVVDEQPRWATDRIEIAKKLIKM